MHELLAPATPLDKAPYNDEFIGMTQETISQGELVETGVRLHEDIQKRLTGHTAKFLLSLHDATPDFELIDLPEAARLPAIRWKLMNLEKLKRHNPEKQAAQREQLERLFQ